MDSQVYLRNLGANYMLPTNVGNEFLASIITKKNLLQDLAILSKAGVRNGVNQYHHSWQLFDFILHHVKPASSLKNKTKHTVGS